MGEVYKAKDTRLDRTVAIKVLPEHLAESPGRKARFEREAKAISQLNHPHICTLYDVGEQDGIEFIVMEYIEGETLAERIAEGPLPVEEAIPLFIQIAEGLEAAHEKGIIHRDLKPSNITIGPDRKPKILDFGLAKVFARDAIVQDLSQSPTLTRNATETGVLLGTAPYMSPERARGKECDKRADVWAFGCCLFEALAGRPVFVGQTVSDTLAKILETEPFWDALPEATAPSIIRLIHRCLTKEPRMRLHDIADARIELEDKDDAQARDRERDGSDPSRRRGVANATVIAVALGALFAGGLAGRILGLSTESSTPPPRRAVLKPPPGVRFQVDSFGTMAFSPDGETIVFVGEDDDGSRLYRLRLDETESQPMPGTEGGSAPFFSPDGAWVAFFTEAGLQKVALAGGPPVTICRTKFRLFDGSWVHDGTIVYSGGTMTAQLWRVSSEGGEPEALPTRAQGADVGHTFTQPLDDGRHLLFTIWRGGLSRTQVGVMPLEGGEPRTLVSGSYGRVTANGYLLFAREQSLWAAPFDSKALELRGPAVPVLDDLLTEAVLATAFYAVSEDGTLIYLPSSSPEPSAGPPQELVSLLPDGSELTLPFEPGHYDNVALSPDGERLAYSHDDDIWVYDIVRDVRTRLTFDEAQDVFPAWTPDGEHIVFSSRRRGGGIFRIEASGSGEAVRLVAADRAALPVGLSVTPDGGHVLYHVARGTGVNGYDVLIASLDGGEGEGSSEPLIAGPFNEVMASVSPNGRWVAYQSDESGNFEVYVRPFPNASSARIQISSGGGQSPIWSREGDALYFQTSDSLMSVPVSFDPTFDFGTPRVLFGLPDELTDGFEKLTGNDARRFFAIRNSPDAPQTASQTELRVVFNWFQELERLVPTN